jgi:hypothetical protein
MTPERTMTRNIGTLSWFLVTLSLSKGGPAVKTTREELLGLHASLLRRQFLCWDYQQR